VRQPSFADILRRALRDHYDAVLAEPIPKRCINLIQQLREVDRQTEDGPAGSETSADSAAEESSRATRNSHD
jgi:hypothetical protein